MKEKDFKRLFDGLNVDVPVLSGRSQRYINLDNAASTPPFLSVSNSVNHFLKYYSSVHRGNGFKSRLSTHAYEEARLRVMAFVGAQPTTHTCLFSKNTTESINKLARRFHFPAGRDVVMVSLMEHHSNDLPWRATARVVRIGLKPDGSLDESDFDAKLAEYRSQVALVSISGASNVTGFINPIHRLAQKAHAAGAQFAVDCAQLAPHRQVTMLPLDDPTHLDYVFISAHKLYAPFGTGALIGRKDTFEQGDPDLLGGGEVEIVTVDDVIWSPPPERDEAGSPNTIGAVALGTALCQLEAVGMQAVAQHEADLTAYALQRLPGVPGLHLFGSPAVDKVADRLGVIPFVLDGKHPALAAAILGYEFGIGVRSGCFCAHPYLLYLLNISSEKAEEIRQQIRNGNRSNVPGMIRISFGLYNTLPEVDALVDALQAIQAGAYQGVYHQDPASGEFAPEGWQADFDRYFNLEQAVLNLEDLP